MTPPPNHPQRVQLNDEVHARPPEPLVAPARVSYLALLCDAEQREASFRAVVALAETCGVAPPEPGDSHYSADLFAFRFKWEKHTEFVRYTFIVPAGTEDPFATTALAAVPAPWIAALPGALMVAAHLVLTPMGDADPVAVGARLFAREVLVGASVSDGGAVAFTDFRIYPDGFSRLLVQDRGMSPWQAGRVCQRLVTDPPHRHKIKDVESVAQCHAAVHETG